jgi:hypothetical protein
MGSSIQDYAQKINSRLTFFDCISLLVTMVFLISLLLYLYLAKKEGGIPVSYNVANDTNGILQSNDARPFGSVSGKTYTFSWCMGSNRISPKNLVYFLSEEDAIRSGRTLSKLCNK